MYSSSGIVKVIKRGRMRSAGHGAPTEEMRSTYKIVIRRQRKRPHGAPKRTNEQTNRVLLEKLVVTQLSKKFLPFIEPEGSFCVYKSPPPPPGPCVKFRNELGFYGEKLLLAPRQSSMLEDHPLSGFRYCLFNVLAVTWNMTIFYKSVKV